MGTFSGIGTNRLPLLALLLCWAAASAPAQTLFRSAEATERIPFHESTPATTPTETPARIQAGPLVRLTGNTGPAIKPQYDRGRAPDAVPQEHILMLLRRDAGRQQALDQFISRQYDPHSPDFHRWLTPQEFGARFAPASGDIEKVTRWLAQNNFTVNHVPAGGLFVDFSGSAGQLAHAFHTQIHHYVVNGEDHYANVGDPYIPAALAPLVSGFRALNDFHPQPHARNLGTARLDRQERKWRPGNTQGAHLASGTEGLYIVGPQDFAHIYGIDNVWQEKVNGGSTAPLLVGTGQTIGIVGEADIENADVQNFRDAFGITALGPNGSVQMENPPSSVCAAPNPTDNEPESYLDVEWSGAMAPDATIDYVACGGQSLTAGSDLAAAYIISDAAHVQKIAVLSTSYGDCEALPESQANQFYVSLWQQAAVEGITVVVAAGDTGPDSCQYVNYYATDGISVANEASTPWNIAAGGTDFSDVFSGTTATYWSATNGPGFLTAQSYIPETSWNESCASPLVLARFGSSFAAPGGPNGFCTWVYQQPPPPVGAGPYSLPYAGSGGLSTVSARPSWQTGVLGLPAQPGRAVPDIAMFASTGLTWGQALILCDSGLADMPAGTACDFNNTTDVLANYGGGTSFVAPAFAGVMALINQKSGDRQGQANYVLYPLAAEQYVTYAAADTPSLANCAAYLGPQSLSNCYFHDVSATPNTAVTPAFLSGNTQIPCTGTATAPGVFTDASIEPASRNENCAGYQITVTQNGTSVDTTPNYLGVLTTADNQPAFAATPGYDLATGLGSPNVYGLVNAPQWSGGGLKTSVALSANATGIGTIIGIGANQVVTLLATVTDLDAVPAVGGTVTFYSGNTVLGTVTQPCSPGGLFTLPVTGSTLGPLGIYRNIFAAFAGGAQQCQGETATYYGAQSAPITVSVSPERLGSNPTLLRPSVPRPRTPGR